MKNPKKKETDQSTEEKIKIAAEKIFMEKGFSGARTRDIADEAGINLALLNYYFRSKENLFEIIVIEKLKIFFDLIVDILTDETIPISEKIYQLADKYTDLLIEEPNLPMFLLSELKQNPDFFAAKLNIKDKVTVNALKLLQHEDSSEDKEVSMQLLMSLLGMTLFPFIAREAMRNVFDISEEKFDKMLNNRRKLIPIWASEIIKTQLK